MLSSDSDSLLLDEDSSFLDVSMDNDLNLCSSTTTMQKNNKKQKSTTKKILNKALSSKKKKISKKNSPFIPDKNIKKETSKVVNKNNDNTSNEEMNVLRRFFPKRIRIYLKMHC